MSRRNESGTFGGAKGGDLLKALAKSMKAVLPKPRSASPTPDKISKDLSAEDELAAAFAKRPAPRLKPIAASIKSKAGPEKEILRVPRGYKLEIGDGVGAARARKRHRPQSRARMTWVKQRSGRSSPCARLWRASARRTAPRSR